MLQLLELSVFAVITVMVYFYSGGFFPVSYFTFHLLSVFFPASP